MSWDAHALLRCQIFSRNSRETRCTDDAHAEFALAGGRYTARRGCVCVCARVRVCAVVGTLSLSLRGLVCSAKPLKGACHSLKSSACTRASASTQPPIRRSSGCTVLWPRAWRVLCRLRPQFPTAGSGSTHRRLSLRPRRQNQPRRVQVLRMRGCHAAYASPIPPMPMAHANGRSSAAHSSDRSDRIGSDRIGSDKIG